MSLILNNQPEGILRGEYVRKYLLALLCSEEVPQGPTCEIGPIYGNCNLEGIDIEDSYTGQVDENAPPQYNDNEEHATITIFVPNGTFRLLPTKVDAVTISVEVIITAHAADGHTRSNILDIITRRFLYRLLSFKTMVDANDNTVKYKSFMFWQKRNNFTISYDDETDFTGNYSIRTLGFTLETQSCIKKGNCEDVPLCFDFSKITPLDKG